MIHDVLIIGGGPAGATTALLMAKAGWSTALIEKKNFPRGKVCGEFISATNLTLMQKLNLADFYTTHGGPPVQRVGLFAADKILTSAMPHSLSTHNKWGRALAREQLDTLLLNEAKQVGVNIWQPWTATHLQKDVNHFSCTITNKERSENISARIVVIAHGSWERDLTQINRDYYKPHHFLAFKARFLNCVLDHDLMPLIAFPGGYGGLVHSDHQHVTLSCCIQKNTLQSVRELNPGLSAGDAVLYHVKSTCSGVQSTFSHAYRDGNWYSIGPIRPGIRKCYSNGIFFVGNMAGEAHPIIAEGISMAMQSAWLLTESLNKHRHAILTQQDSQNAGREYTKKWKLYFANRIRAAALFSHFATRPYAIRLLLPLFETFPGLITYGAKLSGKIKQVIPRVT